MIKLNAIGCVENCIFTKINIMLSPFFKSHKLEAGTDEAGRGCLAGPVTAAAIILPANFENQLLNDSKLLSEKNRFKLKPIIETQAVSFAVTHLEPMIIDEINILNASIKAMGDSIRKLNVSPLYIIVDGNRPLDNTFYNSKNLTGTFNNIPFTSIVKGDSKFMSIAAASVLAKTYRDEYMDNIHEEFPMYNWKQNKGYPTKEHREAIRKHGITKYHRLSFKLL